MSQRWIAAIVTAACTSAAAQTFPDKAVRIVVPYPPGGSTDLDMKTEGEKWANMIKANNITVE